MKSRAAFGLGVLTMMGGLSTLAQAADQPGLFVTGDLSYVLTSGNARASSLAFKSDLTKRWLRTSWLASAGGLRTDSAEAKRTAIGSNVNNFTLQQADPVTTAEAFFAATRLDRKMTERLFWNVGGNWDRDRFAGINGRFVGQGGFGYIFASREDLDFRANVGATYTKQNEIVNDPLTDDKFFGARAGWAYNQKFGQNKGTTLTHSLVADQNLKQTDDLRIDGQVALAVAINSRLALKAGVRMLFDNLPALEQMDLISPTGVKTNLKVTAPHKKVDTTASIALVINITKKGGGASRQP